MLLKSRKTEEPTKWIIEQIKLIGPKKKFKY